MQTQLEFNFNFDRKPAHPVKDIDDDSTDGTINIKDIVGGTVLKIKGFENCKVQLEEHESVDDARERLKDSLFEKFRVNSPFEKFLLKFMDPFVERN